MLKLNPVTLMKNPVIFVVEIGAALVLLFLIRDIVDRRRGDIGFELQIDLWLWFTVLFATFAEAMAEARGKAQAESLRKTKTDTIANRVVDGGRIEQVSSSKLRAGDIVVCSGRRDRFPVTARSSKASRRSTSRSSPERARR